MKLLHKKIKTCKECPHFTYKDYYGIQCAYCTKLNTFFTDEDRVVEIQKTQVYKNYISSFITPLHNCPLPEVKNEEQQSEILHSTDETVINAFGGKQSRIAGRPTLLPAESILRVVKILTVGADKYGDENWRQITQKEHLDHALLHILLYLDGDKSEDHLGNAACRLLFSIADIVKDNKDENPDVDNCGENTTA